MLKFKITDTIIIMPSRNIVRKDADDSYYHVYARGSSKQPVFLSDEDKQKFISLFDRYLTSGVKISKTGEAYPNYKDDIEVLSYCLMDNHFHLFVHQVNEGGLTKLMRGIQTSYVRYFNLKYGRSGSLFESRYKASYIDDESYYVHISRYIHLNKKNWKYYPYSSINYYRKGNEPSWLNTDVVLSMFDGRRDYIQFLEDYAGYKAMLDEIKYDLADQ